MKHPLSFSKLVMAAAVALPTMALATITPVTPQQDTDNCYMIGSAAELYGFAKMVNGTGGGFNGCGKLTADIVVNENVLGTDNANVNASGAYTGDDSNFEKWAPINGFAGKFHGQGHTISGLYFNDPEKENVGLFGSVGNVEIDGLGLVDSYFEGRFFVGGFIGYAEDVDVYIRDSYNSSVMRGHSDGAWQGGVGGFVGALNVCNLEIENSYNLGFVTGERDAGGFVGYIWGYFNNYVIFNSYNRGSVISAEPDCAGGFVGTASDEWVWLYVYNSYNAGKVNGGEGFALMSGGFGPEGVDNFYYLDGSANGWGVNYGEKESTPAADFADGTVAKLLHDYSGTAENETAIDGSVWGQGLGRDALPTLTGAIGPALTLHVYDGVVIDSVYTPGTELPAPTREGFAFLGWYADAGFSGSAVTEIPDGATGALEYFAKWEAQGGSGCIEIANAADLFSFAARVNGGDGEICGELTADITVNENVLTSDGVLNVDLEDDFAPWTPIGTSSAPFKGTFYGQGHTISGLYYSQWALSYANVGLFGYVEGKVIIDGVGIVDSYISANNSVGALVGKVGGSSTDGTSLTISNSYNAGRVSGQTGSIGGLVGGVLSSVVINNSYNAGFVNGANKSLSTGGLVGSLSESATASINNSYNAGSVTGKSEKLYDDLVCGTGEVAITNSFYIGESLFEGNGATKKTAEEFANGSVAKALHDWCEKETGSDKCKEGGLDGSVWGQDVLNGDPLPNFSDKITGTLHDLVLHTFEGDSRVYPTKYLEETGFVLPTDLTREGYIFLGWYKTSYFSGSVVTKIPANATGKLEYYAKWMKFSDNCYEIASAEDLYDFAAIVNGGAGEICGKLTDDISVNENVLTSDGSLNADLKDDFAPWTPMNVSDGVTVTLDGNGHTISGLYFNNENTDNVGLFGEVLGAVSISDLGVVDFYVKGNREVGSLAGQVSKGKLNIKNSFSAGSVEGKNYVGGFVGLNKDNGEVKIENCYNESSVNAFPGIVGGLVGDNNGGTLNVSNCYNVGVVTASNGNVGGLVGYNDDGTLNVLNCYNVGAVRGIQYIGGLVGANLKGTMSVSNSFFIGTNGDGDKLGGEAKTPNEFADGTVALLLHNWCEMDGGVCKADGLDGSIWGQNVGQASDNDAAPTLSGMLKLGLLAIAKDAAGKDTVAIDGNSALEVKIPADIHVDYVKFNRTFTQGIVATIVLPFDVPSSALPGNAEFGTLKSVGPNPENGGKWEAVFTTVTELEAHTPYLVRLTSGTSLDFKFGEAGVTIKATEEYDEVSGKMVTVPTSSTSTDEQWKLVGTYSYKSWQDGDLGIGSTYGFAGSAEGENVVAGQFVKVGAGAYINPMRVYLQKVTKVNPGRRALGNASVLASIPEELPESIDVVFVDSDDAADANEVAAGSDSAAEKTTYIGRINTRTGAIELKRTYDAKGRMLNSKPTAKGNYFNKKVIK